MEPSLVVAGDVGLLAHALVLPTGHAGGTTPQSRKSPCALRTRTKKRPGQRPTTFRGPSRVRRAALGDWPGFDPLPVSPARIRRALEVKGRVRTGDIELSENESAEACNPRDGYELYAVYDCATPRPRLVRVRDPFRKLLAKGREISVFSQPLWSVRAAAEGDPGSAR